MTSVTSTERNKEEYIFIYGDDDIAYEVVRKPHTQKINRKIAIKVHPSCEVIVTAPEDANRSDIHAAVMKRAKWIYEGLKDFRSQQEFVQPKRYVSGEMQFYLGRRYVLKVVENPETFSSVKLLGGKLLVSLLRFGDRKESKVQALVRSWYKTRAERVFAERLTELVTHVPWVERVPKFRVLTMQKQWGSCSVRGTLMLNPHLVKSPKECIDYVIFHELCHISEHNHSDKFWRLLTSVMPHWKEVKAKLDGMAELYLNE